MKFRSLLTGLVLALLISGCSWTQVKDTGKAVAGGTYLYYEYSNLVNSIKALPLTEEERAPLIVVDESINATRIEIGARYELGGAAATIALLDAENYMNSLKSAFVDGERIVRAHFSRRDMPVPAQYEFYTQQAQATYKIVSDAIEVAGDRVDLDVVGFYLRAGIQALIVSQLGPVGGVAAGALLNSRSL